MSGQLIAIRKHLTLFLQSWKGNGLKANTVGAYLFNDRKATSGSENISNSLINKTAAIAEVGLKFYEAMLEDDRAALKNI